MSKITYQGANVEISTDTFGGLVNKTNQVIYDMGTVVMTVGDVAQPNTINGALTTGNAHVEGIFSADIVAVPTTLRGGTVSTPSDLSITSNAIFSDISEVIFDNVGTVNVKGNSNTLVEGHTVFNGTGKTITVDLGTGNTTINSGEVFVNANAYFTTANVEFDVTTFDLSGNLFHVGSKAYFDTSNTTIGSANTQNLNINSNSVLNGTATFNNTIVGNGAATFNSTALFNGNVTLGNSTTDTVTYVSRISSDIIPNNSTRNFGSESLPWAELHGINAYIDADVEAKGELRLLGNTVKTVRAKSTTTGYQSLDFVLETSTGNTKTPIVLTSAGVVSGANNAYTLGSTTNLWKHVHATDLSIANSAIISNALDVSGPSTLATVKVSDLTSGRMTYAGAGGELQDSANMIFDGTDFIVSSAKVSDLTSGRVTYAGAGGALIDSANMIFDGTDFIVSSAKVSDLTSGRVLFVGADGALVDAAALTYDNTHLTTPSLKVSDLTSGRVALVGLSGELQDDPDLTFDGTTLSTKIVNIANTLTVGKTVTLGNAIDGDTTVKGDLIAEKTLNVSGATTLSTAKVSDLTSGRVTYAGAGGELMDNPNLTFNATHLNVPAIKSANLTSGRVALVGTAGEIVDDANITFGLDTLTIPNIAVSTDLAAGGTISLGNAVNGDTTIKGGLIAEKTLSVTGATTLSTVRVSNLTSGRVVLAGTSGELMDNSNITFTSNRLTVPNANVTTDFMVGGFTHLGNAAGGDTEVKGNLTVDKNLTILGDTVFSSNASLSYSESNVERMYVSDILDVAGNTVIGSANTDTVAINSRISTDVIPTITNTNSLGSATHAWKELFVDTLKGKLDWSFVQNKPDPVITVTMTGDVVGSASTTLTDLSNGTISIATTVQPNSIVLGTDTTGNYVSNVTAGSGVVVSGSSGEGVVKTISHADTSSVSNISIDNTSGVVLQDIALTFDTFGHVQTASATSIDLDSRYSKVAFSDIVTPSGTVSADAKADTLTFSNGSGVSISGNATTDTITIASTDTIDSVVARGSSTSRAVSFGAITGTTGNLSGDLTVGGDLTVNGTVTTVNTETVTIADNIIVLNSNESGTPSQDSGFEIERGIFDNKSFLWDETNDRWTLGTDSLVAGTFIGALSGNSSTATKLKTARTISLSGDVSGSTTFDGSGNATISVVVADDSHNHTIANVDGLQTALNAKLDATANAVSASKLATARTISLGGDVSGSVSFNGTSNVTITATVANNSHAHTIANVTGLQTNLNTIEADIDSLETDVGALQTDMTNVEADVGALQTDTAGLRTDVDSKLPANANAVSASKLKTARTISLNGDATGSVSFDGSGNVTLTTAVVNNSHTHTIANVTGLQTELNGLQSDVDSKLAANANAVSASKLVTARTIALSGDVSGSVSFNGTSNVTITATVADDSHNHTIANIDGLQTQLNGINSDIGTKSAKSANLSDLTNVATARTNLGLGSAATVNTGTGANQVVKLDGSAKLPAVDGSNLTGIESAKIGDVQASFADLTPHGYLPTDGSVYNQSAYPELFEKMGLIIDTLSTNPAVNSITGDKPSYADKHLRAYKSDNNEFVVGAANYGLVKFYRYSNNTITLLPAPTTSVEAQLTGGVFSNDGTYCFLTGEMWKKNGVSDEYLFGILYKYNGTKYEIVDEINMDSYSSNPTSYGVTVKSGNSDISKMIFEGYPSGTWYHITRTGDSVSVTGSPVWGNSNVIGSVYTKNDNFLLIVEEISNKVTMKTYSISGNTYTLAQSLSTTVTKSLNEKMSITPDGTKLFHSDHVWTINNSNGVVALVANSNKAINSETGIYEEYSLDEGGFWLNDNLLYTNRLDKNRYTYVDDNGTPTISYESQNIEVPLYYAMNLDWPRHVVDWRQFQTYAPFTYDVDTEFYIPEMDTRDNFKRNINTYIKAEL